MGLRLACRTKKVFAHFMKLRKLWGLWAELGCRPVERGLSGHATVWEVLGSLSFAHLYFMSVYTYIQLYLCANYYSRLATAANTVLCVLYNTVLSSSAETFV